MLQQLRDLLADFAKDLQLQFLFAALSHPLLVQLPHDFSQSLTLHPPCSRLFPQLYDFSSQLLTVLPHQPQLLFNSHELLPSLALLQPRSLELPFVELLEGSNSSSRFRVADLLSVVLAIEVLQRRKSFLLPLRLA
jgi:hypothetical protein